MVVRTLTALAAVLALLVVAAPARAQTAAATGPVIGIAEQHPTIFNDPLFTATGIKTARLLVGWNGIFSDWQRDEIDAWMGSARRAGIDPLVTFGRSRTDHSDLPTPARFAAAFAAFRQRYPWVRTFATWNEANHSGEPVFKRPDLVARYWLGMRSNCPGCTVLPAELIDLPNVPAWTAAFRIAARTEPPIWGLHNYLDANRFLTSGTKAMLAAVPGQVWLTETGGIVARNNGSKISFPQGADHAAKATEFVLGKLLALSPRVARVYLYNWQAEQGTASWDSGLIDPLGKPRAAYQVLVDRIKGLRATAARRAREARTKSARRRAAAARRPARRR